LKSRKNAGTPCAGQGLCKKNLNADLKFDIPWNFFYTEAELNLKIRTAG
jgi:hypothetical protein